MRGFLSGIGNAKDNFRDSYADPVIPDGPDFSNFSEHSTALPFDSQPPDVRDVDLATVNPLAGIISPASPIIPTQDIFNDLEAIRAKMPWLPIIQFPQAMRTAFMTVANTPVDIAIPTGAAFVQFSGPQDFYVSFGNRAVTPSATTDLEASSLYKPSGYFFIGGVKQISVVSPSGNAIVQAAFWNR